ncbi:helix-turn-helix domain-containing protein [Streptomyces sp. NPDC059783]|uniref:MmyB family transcriptional regulator n=1 Tax=Streptomyces sp. NPDC059783 TaxID=3346944 RepID=UPI00364B9032
MHVELRRRSGEGAAAEALTMDMRVYRLQDFLRSRRSHLGLTMLQVAARLRISERSYGNWERGRVKEWTDEKLYRLAEALEMSEYQTSRLFLYAVDRAPEPDLRTSFGPPSSSRPSQAAFLGDYSVLMDALSLPTFVIDRSWDVKMTNAAYREMFRNVRSHPTAMPTHNLLRFGLFHPDASSVFADYGKWRLAFLAQLSSSLERHSDDVGLQSLRRDVYRHSSLRDAYLNEMPPWVMDSGTDLIHQESQVRVLRHPDPRLGLQGCRLVEETSRSLTALGLTRLALVLVDLDGRAQPPGGPAEGSNHVN